MENILKNKIELKFEKKNSFNNGESRCYYKENLNGFIVFFLFKNGVVDLGFYNKDKKQISFVISINESIKENWQEQFITQIIKD